MEKVCLCKKHKQQPTGGVTIKITKKAKERRTCTASKEKSRSQNNLLRALNDKVTARRGVTAEV